MAEIEKYSDHNGQELRTQIGNKVITVVDIAAEKFAHLKGLTMDDKGNAIVPTEGNYFIDLGLDDPNDTTWFATTVAGDYKGKKKINSVYMYRHETPGRSQIVFNEEGYNPETGKSGQVKPMIYHDKENNRTYVSTQTANRYGNQVVEVDRRDYNRPVEELAKLQDEKRYEVIKLTEKELGLGMSNTARVTAPGGRLALLSREATLLRGGSEKPVIENGIWQPYEQFITENMEDMGRDAVMTVKELYNLPVNHELLETYKAKIPSYVEAQLAKEKAK